MREAPSLTAIAELTQRGARVRVYDPAAMGEAAKLLGANPAVSYAADMYEALDGADGLIVVTEWKVFRAPDFERMREMLRTPLVVDGRNVYNPARMRAMGFEYQGIGRI